MFVSALIGSLIPLAAQTPGAYQSPVHHQVDPRNTYHRVIAVVPYIGSGKPGDPKRPKYVPAPGAPASAHTGILGFVHVPSDDGSMAIVEFVANERSTLTPILNDKSVTSFEKGGFMASRALAPASTTSASPRQPRPLAHPAAGRSTAPGAEPPARAV